MAPHTNVDSPPDGANLSRRGRWLTDAELIARVEADYAARDVRLYPYKLNHLVDAYGVFRKWAAANRVTAGHASWYQAAQLLYDDLPTRDDAIGVIRSVKRWARELERLGVLEVREHKNGRGQFDGIWWALPSDVASARSSAGSSVGSCYRRRQETRQEARERRVRPWCRRSGRKGVDRHVPVSAARRPPAPFLRVESCLLHSPPPPTGAGGVLQDVARAAPAVDAVGSSSGAPPAVQGRNVGNGSAAPEAHQQATRTRSGAPDRAAELEQALEAYERRFGHPSIPVAPHTFELWKRAASRGDLYGGWGKRSPGLALRYVVDRIEAWTGDPRPARFERGTQLRRPAEPASVAYFVALLEDASKHWRHAYRHEHGLCRRPELCRANAWMYPALDDRIRDRSKWVAYDREVANVRRVLNGAGYATGSGDA